MSSHLKEKQTYCQPLRQSDCRRRYRRRKAPPPTATLSLDASSLAVFAAQIKGLVDATVEQRFATIDRELLHLKKPNPLLVPKLEPAYEELNGVDCDDSMGFQFVAVNEPEDDEESSAESSAPAPVELPYCLSTDSRLSDSLIYSLSEKQLYCLKNSYKKQKRFVCKTATCWSAVVLTGKVLKCSPNFAPHNHKEVEQEAFELGFDVEGGKQQAVIDESFQLPSRNLRNLRTTPRTNTAVQSTTPVVNSSRRSVKSSKSPGQVAQESVPKKEDSDDDDSDDDDSSSGDEDDSDDSDDDDKSADEKSSAVKKSNEPEDLRYRITTGIRFNPDYEDNMIYVMGEKQIYRKTRVFPTRTQYVCRLRGCSVSRYMYGKKLRKLSDLEHNHGDQAELERKLAFNCAFRVQCLKPGANPSQVYATLRKKFPKNINYTLLTTLKTSLEKQKEMQQKAKVEATRKRTTIAAKRVPQTKSKPIAEPVKKPTATPASANPKPSTGKPATTTKSAAKTRSPTAARLNTMTITDEQALLLARSDCVSSAHKILAYRHFKGCRMLYTTNEKQVYHLHHTWKLRSVYQCMVRGCPMRANMFGQVLRLYPNGKQHTHGTQEVYAKLKDAAGGKRVTHAQQRKAATAFNSPPASEAATVPSTSARRRATAARSSPTTPAATPPATTRNTNQRLMARSQRSAATANNSPRSPLPPSPSIAEEMCPKTLLYSKGKKGSVDLVYTIHEHQSYRLKHLMKGRKRYVCRYKNCRAEVFLFDDGQLRRPTQFRRHNHGRQMREFDSESPRPKSLAPTTTGNSPNQLKSPEVEITAGARKTPVVASNGDKGKPEAESRLRSVIPAQEMLIEMADNQAPGAPSSDDDDYDEGEDEASQSEQSLCSSAPAVSANVNNQPVGMVRSRKRHTKAEFPGPAAYRHICSRKRTRHGNFGQLLYTIDEKHLYRLHDKKSARYSCRIRTCGIGFNMRNGMLFQSTPGPLQHNHGDQEAYAARLERQARKRPLGVQPILVKIERRPSGDELRIANRAPSSLEYSDDDSQFLVGSSTLEEDDHDYVDMTADAIAVEADDYVELEYRLANGEQVMRQSLDAGCSGPADAPQMVNVETADHIYCLTNGAPVGDEEMSEEMSDGHHENDPANSSLDADVDVESSMVDDLMYDDEMDELLVHK